VKQAGSPRTVLDNPRAWTLALIGLIVAIGAVWVSWNHAGLSRIAPDRIVARGIPVSTSASPYKNTGRGVAFVGDEVCARCHAEISQAFRQHPMGRSMTMPESVLPEVSGVVFEADDLVYSIERRGGRVFHQEAKHDSTGRVVSKTEAEVQYVIGSGTRGYSFLIQRGENLFQSPIAWYRQEQTWDLAPEYREVNLHFDRIITSGCLFCHTNRFDREEGHAPVFHGLAIGCERCHGPGGLHAQGPAMAGGKDLTIVNPLYLEPATLRENVCEQCHFQGTQRIERSDGSSFDYRPGLNLADFMRIISSQFDPTLRNRAVGHVEQMRESRCFKESAGALGCISCHDPHRLPEGAARVAYYRDRCLKCHADPGCSLPREARLEQNPQDDCISCHMPQRGITAVAHTALTDHRIPRRSSREKPPPGGATHGRHL
jgi:hypothetical protein